MNMDNNNYRGNFDTSRVNVHENYEVEYWANKFGVRPEQVRQAVEIVGMSSIDVEQYFKK
jgi:hypothetical protein